MRTLLFSVREMGGGWQARKKPQTEAEEECALKRSLKRCCKKLVVLKFLTDAKNRAGTRENKEQDVP